MVPPPEIVQYLVQKYRKPQIDPVWLNECSEWLLSDGNCSVENMPDFKGKAEEQLLKSDLSDSMLHHTGLDSRISQFTGILQGAPTLVQILAITEIGSSASHLEQVRVAREERMRSGEGNIEGEEDGDVEIEGEGPMPKYPRGQLQFRLSDGLTTFEATEYRRLSGIVLGNTSLGYKMQLNKTRFRNGMAFLEPSTVTLLGGESDELEQRQLHQFQQSLRSRRGLPLLPEPATPQEIVDQPLGVQPPIHPAAARSPLRDISPPPAPAFPERDDDINLEPRRRIPTRSVLRAIPDPSSSGERKIVPLPTRHSRMSSDNQEDVSKPSVAERATLLYAGASQSNSATPSCFGSGSGHTLRSSAFEVNKVVEHLDFNMEPTGRQLSRTLPSPSPEPPATNQHTRLEPSPFDFNFFDEAGENQRPGIQPPKNNDKGKGPMQIDRSTKNPVHRGGDSSDEYGFMDDENDFADASFLGDLDRVEKAALEASYSSVSVPRSSSMSGSGAASSSLASSYIMVDKGKGTTKSIGEPATQASDVIEIDDSDEEMLEPDDKENKPVPTRHVRRRTEDGIAGPAFPSQQRTSRKSKRPVVLASNPEDIIDLSD